VEVEDVDAEFGGGLVEGVQGPVVAVVVDPDLRLDEGLLAGHARASDRFAHFAFVEVRGGGVDVAVARRQGGRDRVGGLLRRGLEHAEAEGGHDDPVVHVRFSVMTSTLGTPSGAKGSPLKPLRR
jgi:hypothetical protein